MSSPTSSRRPDQGWWRPTALRSRREVCLSAGAMALAGGLPAAAQMHVPTRAEPAPPSIPATPPAFGIERIRETARLMASKPYIKPAPAQGRAQAADYDTYRKIRFRPERALWHATPPTFELHGLPMGWLYEHPVEIYVIENGQPVPVAFTGGDFLDDRGGGATLPEGPVPLSGFRINGPLNGTLRADEIIVFQGASYFRALAQGHVYGLSARGLAVGSASMKGEEFPVFRSFWIERPAPSADSFVIHALLHSPSTTGAYTFQVRPGVETIVEVRAWLYPRTEITEVGLAPLTSMFMVGPSGPPRISDFRPRVHDSDGLAILNGRGERLWRPLANPPRLQVSAFVDDGPRGFGLVQRNRRLSDHQDLEAHYHRRPTAWVELPRDLGPGSIVLTEIPTDEEVNDNIVAFWRPAAPLQQGQEHALSYRLHWRDDSPTRLAGPWVEETRIGRAHHTKPGGVRFVVDYVDEAPFDAAELPAAKASASRGTIESTFVQRNPVTGGLRASFILHPGSEKVVDLRLELAAWGKRQPETWVYRWTTS